MTRVLNKSIIRFMKRFLLLILGILIFFCLGKNTLAETPQLSQHWVCLNVDWCIDQTAFAEGKVVPNPACSPASRGNGHRVRLTAKNDAKPLPNSDTYIVECLSTTNGDQCTTGNTADDNLVYGKDNSAALKISDKYQFQGIFEADGTTSTTNPQKSNASGDIGPVEWQSYSKGNARKFLAVNFFDASKNTDYLGRGGQQQNTFSFDAANNATNCIAISWDPYGRVFDSQTLEPIPQAVVVLQVQRRDGSFSQLLPSEVLGGAIVNPFITKEDGSFSFVVPDGTYKLNVSDPNYQFPSDLSKLNSNYTKIYSDIYPGQTGDTVSQHGTILHRDIPLDSKTGAGMSYPVKLMQYFYELNKETGQAVVEGRTSHPFSVVNLYSDKVGATSNQTPTRFRLLTSQKTDSSGKFKIAIDQTTFAKDEIFGEIEVRKSNLINSLGLNFLFGLFNVYAQPTSSTVVRVNPIPNNIQGYAYDQNGTVMPNARVGIYLSFSNKPYYETSTDQNGYYAIDTNNLPNLPYRLQYVSSTGVTSNVSTTQYVQGNQKYLASNKISIYNPSGGVQTPTAVPQNQNQNLNQTSARLPAAGSSTTSGSQSANPVFLIAAILLILILVVTGLILFYIRRKNQIDNSTEIN